VLKFITSWRTYAVLVSIVLAVFIFSRCTPTDTQSQSTQTPTALPTPVEVEPTPSPEPEEITPVVEESESPKAKPTAEPSVSKTKEKIPPAKKSATPKPSMSNEPSPPPSEEPTSTPQPIDSPKPGRTPNEYGYLVPIVTFTTKSCVIKGEFVGFTYTVFLSEGNHYSYQEPWRGGRIWTVRDGRSWSFEYYEGLPSRIINNPRVILPDRTLRIIGSGKTDYIPLPKLDFSSCK
jgi:hypothetical protein